MKEGFIKYNTALSDVLKNDEDVEAAQQHIFCFKCILEPLDKKFVQGPEGLILMEIGSIQLKQLKKEKMGKMFEKTLRLCFYKQEHLVKICSIAI